MKNIKFLNLKSYILNLKSSIIFSIRKNNTGFTLVEMIVAIALFSVVMVMGMGSLLNVLTASKQNQAIQTAVNNLGLAMEMMSREIRTGYNYHCGTSGSITDTQDCMDGENYIAFEPYYGDPSNSNDQVVFKIENNRIQKSIDSGSHFASLTANELVIDNGSYFVVVGSDPDDTDQPKVIIAISGAVASNAKVSSPFNLQTTVSQRLLDF